MAATLLSVPLEVRFRIYSYLVVPKRIFFSPASEPDFDSPRYRHWSSYEKPSVQLFAVCRQILVEAEAEYATGNVFVLPSSFCFQRPSLGCHRPLMSRRAWQKVRRISVGFDTGVLVLRDILPTTSFNRWIAQGEMAAVYEWTVRRRRSNMRETHNLMTTFQLNWLVTCLRDLRDLLQPRPLLALELDIGCWFCPLACHRLTDYVGRYIGLLPLPNSISIYGALSVDEMTAFATEIQQNPSERQWGSLCLHFSLLGDTRDDNLRIDEQSERYFQCDRRISSQPHSSVLPSCWNSHRSDASLSASVNTRPVRSPSPVFYSDIGSP